MVEYLIAHGADPLIKDIRNGDALTYACREGRKDVVEFLERSLIYQKSY
jgi:ankyrin repeat protein